MNELDDLKNLLREDVRVRPDGARRAAAIEQAADHFAKISAAAQGNASSRRLRNRIATIWNRRKHMLTLKPSHALMAGASLAAVTMLMLASPVLKGLSPESERAPVSVPPATVAEAPKDLAVEDEAPPAPAGSAVVVMKEKVAPSMQKSMANRAVSADSLTGMAPVQAVIPADSRDRFAVFGSNPVKQAAADPLSTFSIDVDSSSYSFVRRSLMGGVLPPKDAVRVEEMVNYFPYDYEAPSDRSAPFKANVSLMQTPWNKDTKLMRIGIRGYALDAAAQRPHANLVFLIDTSGSMEEPDKLPLLLNSFRLLLDTLKADDSVAIVTYAGSAGTVLAPTKVAEKGKILAALGQLQAGGSTAGAEGIRLAYDLARQNFDKDGVNRVILATDGDFNVGISDPRELEDAISRERESGIYLSVLGFGEGNYNDALMQSLAQHGNGNAAYIDTLNEARKVLVDEATSTLFPIANDVKIQVEFNPATVSEYRLIGYETRLLNKEDFNNDRVDAGDIGAGHTVTALYEVTPTGSAGQLVDPLRYGRTDAGQGAGDEYAFVKIRYKLPGEQTSRLITEPVTAADEKPSQEASFAAAVAAFGQILRGGQYTRNFGYDDVIALASESRGKDEYGYRSEFVNLVRLAKSARPMP